MPVQKKSGNLLNTRNPDSDTVSSSMSNQVKYFVAIDSFDIHGNILLKYDPNVNPTIGLGLVFL